MFPVVVLFVSWNLSWVRLDCHWAGLFLGEEFGLVSNMGRHLLPFFSNDRARPMRQIITNLLLLGAIVLAGCLRLPASFFGTLHTCRSWVWLSMCSQKTHHMHVYGCLHPLSLHPSNGSMHCVWLLALAVLILVHVVWLHTLDMIKT